MNTSWPQNLGYTLKSAWSCNVEANGTESGARLKKSKRLAAKTAGKSSKTQPPPASSIESLLELEITKAQLEMARIKSVSAELHTPLGQPRLLQAALTSTPGRTLGWGILRLELLELHCQMWLPYHQRKLF